MKPYRGRYERPIYWGDSKPKRLVQQAAAMLEGVFFLTVVGGILVAIILTICIVIGG